MQKPWNIFLGIIAVVGCLGLAILVGALFLTDAQERVGENPASSLVSPSKKTPTNPTGSVGGAPADQQVLGREMSPSAMRAQNPNGAWNNDLTLLKSEDGVVFTGAETVVENGGVPSMATGADGTLYLVFQWFPIDDDDAFDKIAVKKSFDNGTTWTDPELIVIDHFSEDYARPYDPTIVAGTDGKLHLFFTTGTTRILDTAFITSAVGTDGVHFTWEEGMRMDVTNEPNYDCAAAEMGGTWYLTTPRWPDASGSGINQAYVATSENGVSFDSPTKITGASSDMNWTGNLLVEDDTLWFYGSSMNGPWRASSTNGSTWGDKIALTMSQRVGDPAITKTTEGSYLLVGVSLPERAR